MRYAIREIGTDRTLADVAASDALGALNAYMDREGFAHYVAPGTAPNGENEPIAAYNYRGTVGGVFTNTEIYAHATIADGIGYLIDASYKVRGFGAGPDERDHFLVAAKVLGIELDDDPGKFLPVDLYATELYELPEYHDGNTFTSGVEIARWVVERLAADCRIPAVMPRRIPSPAEVFPAAADQFPVGEFPAIELGREFRVTLTIYAPDGDTRAPDAIGWALKGALEVGSDDDEVAGLTIVQGNVEEVTHA